MNSRPTIDESDALAHLRHRHHRRVAGGIWYERDRDIASLLAVVDALTAARHRLDRDLTAACAELARLREERDRARRRLAHHEAAHERRFYA